MAIGLANSSTIDEINVSSNEIDHRGIKALETLLRYIHNLRKVDISNNPIGKEELKELKRAIQMHEHSMKKEVKIN